MPATLLVEPTPDDAILRRTMVDCQIRTFDVTDHVIIARFLDVPRENFLPAELASVAYSDMALKLAPEPADTESRVLLTPAVLARLIQAAAIKPGDKILDIASATGYSTAILAGLAKEVVALESSLTRSGMIKTNLASIGISAVHVLTGPLADGAAAEGPFDVIFVNGAVEGRLDRLFQQLRPAGRLLTIQHLTEAPGAGASHAVRFESQSGRISSVILFDAGTSVLTEFRKPAEFVF